MILQEDKARVFQGFMADNGYHVDSVIPDGKIHRFNLRDRKGLPGWYVYHADGASPAGVFGDWISGERFAWSGGNGNKPDRRIVEKRKAEEDRSYQQAAEKAKAIWEKSKPAPPCHPYLKRKKVKAYGIRQALDGRLVVPAYGPDGNIQTIQFIDGDGRKLFLACGKKAGAFFTIPGNQQHFLCEGYATGASIHEATGGTVIVGFDAINLLPAAESFRKNHPDVFLIIAGDNDQWTAGNPGQTKAAAVAEKISNATVILPKFTDESGKPTDFNDLHEIGGLGAVKSQLRPKKGFPYEAMIGAAGLFTQIYSEYLESPQQFFFFSYLTCLGSVLSDTLTLETELQPQPRLYTLLLGQSADERKSTAISKTCEFFRDSVDNFEMSLGVNSAEGLQARFEAIGGRLLLVFDEFKQFVSKCRIDSSILLPCVTTLFESNRYESTTKAKHLLLEGSRLSVLAASTVSTYERTWDPSFTDIGFNNRLFIVPGTADRRFSFPKKIPSVDKAELRRNICAVISHAKTNSELRITDAARDQFHDWYMGLERSVHAKRLDVYALRLLALLAANSLKSCVDAEIADHATRLCDWQLEMRKLYDPIDADGKTAQTEEKIRRVLRCGPLSERELKRAVNYQRDGLWVFNSAIKNLSTCQEIYFEKKAKKWILT